MTPYFSKNISYRNNNKNYSKNGDTIKAHHKNYGEITKSQGKYKERLQSHKENTRRGFKTYPIKKRRSDRK